MSATACGKPLMPAMERFGDGFSGLVYLRTLTSSEATDVEMLMKENQMVTD